MQRSSNTYVLLYAYRYLQTDVRELSPRQEKELDETSREAKGLPLFDTTSEHPVFEYAAEVDRHQKEKRRNEERSRSTRHAQKKRSHLQLAGSIRVGV